MAPARQSGLTSLRRDAGTTLQPAEQRWALIGSLGAAAGFTALNLSLHNPAHAALGVGFAALLAAAAWSRNRLAVAVGCVLIGFGPWNFLFLAGAPFYVFALVLLYRARRAQELAGPEPDVPAASEADDDGPTDHVKTDDAPQRKVKPHPRSKKKKPRRAPS